MLMSSWRNRSSSKSTERTERIPLIWAFMQWRVNLEQKYKKKRKEKYHYRSILQNERRILSPVSSSAAAVVVVLFLIEVTTRTKNMRDCEYLSLLRDLTGVSMMKNNKIHYHKRKERKKGDCYWFFNRSLVWRAQKNKRDWQRTFTSILFSCSEENNHRQPLFLPADRHRPFHLVEEDDQQYRTSLKQTQTILSIDRVRRFPTSIVFIPVSGCCAFFIRQINEIVIFIGEQRRIQLHFRQRSGRIPSSEQRIRSSYVHRILGYSSVCFDLSLTFYLGKSNSIAPSEIIAFSLRSRLSIGRSVSYLCHTNHCVD